MGANYAIGKGGMVLCALVALAMCVLAFVLQPVSVISSNPGICLPPVAEWNLIPQFGWAINTFLIVATTLGSYYLNNTFNFIRSPHPVLPAAFCLLLSSNAWISGNLSSAMILCAVVMGCMAILFSSYNSKNATQEMFVTATFFGVGSMFEIAFIPMIIPMILGANVMKILRFKEIIAFVLGLVAPYWVGVGLGLIPLEAFHLPDLSLLFSSGHDLTDFFFLLLDTGILALAGLLIGVSCAIRLYAGNAFVSAMNFSVAITGLIAIAFAAIDFSNITAYLAVFYFSVAVQISQLCALWKMRHEWIVVTLIALLSIGFFISTLIG